MGKQEHSHTYIYIVILTTIVSDWDVARDWNVNTILRLDVNLNFSRFQLNFHWFELWELQLREPRGLSWVRRLVCNDVCDDAGHSHP